MKKINAILGILKLIIKFGSIFMIFIDIVNYIIDKIEEYNKNNDIREPIDLTKIADKDENLS